VRRGRPSGQPNPAPDHRSHTQSIADFADHAHADGCTDRLTHRAADDTANRAADDTANRAADDTANRTTDDTADNSANRAASGTA